MKVRANIIFLPSIAVFLFLMGHVDVHASKKEEILITEKKPQKNLDDPTRPWLDIQKPDYYFGREKNKLSDTKKTKKLKDLIVLYNTLEKTGISIRRILVPLTEPKLQWNNFDKDELLQAIKENSYYPFGLFRRFKQCVNTLPVLNDSEKKALAIFMNLRKLASKGLVLLQEKSQMWKKSVKDLLKPSQIIFLKIEKILDNKEYSSEKMANNLLDLVFILGKDQSYQDNNDAQQIINKFLKEVGDAISSIKKCNKNELKNTSKSVIDNTRKDFVKKIRDAIKFVRGRTYPVPCWKDLDVDFYIPLTQYPADKAFEKLISAYGEKYKKLTIDSFKQLLLDSEVFTKEEEAENLFNLFVKDYKNFFNHWEKNCLEQDTLKKYFVAYQHMVDEASLLLKQEKFVLIRRNLLLKIASNAKKLHDKKLFVGKYFSNHEKEILKNIFQTARRKANYLVNIWFFDKKQMSILFSLPRSSMVPTKSLRKVREKNDHIVSQFHMVDPYYRFEMPTKEWEKQVEKEFAKGVVPRFLLWLEDKDGRDFTSNAAYTISPQEKFVKIEKGFCFTRVFRQDAVENKMEKSEFGVVADGMYLYVIGQDKNLYIIPEMSKKDYYDGNKQLITFAKKKYPAIDWGLQWEFHADSYWEPKHDTILQGNNVICAGTIIFKKGKIVRITNDSGHYQPTAHHLANGIWTLIRKNGDNDTIFNQKAYVDIWAGSNKITCMLTNFLKKNPKKEAKIIIIKSIAQEKALVIEKQTDTPVLSKAKKWIQSLKDASREDVKKSLETYDKQKKIKKKNKKKIEKDETDFSLIKKSDLK